MLTGRVVDSALTLGPLMHEFGWSPDQFDLLSAGSLAGHLLECGPQSTGGLLTDWTATASWADPGFPLAIMQADGTFEITCATGTDALVDHRSVAEQVLYEIGDPTAYLLPDVTCDWSGVELEETGPNRVLVRGARGRAPVPTLKACAQIPDGFRVAVQYFVGGRDAVAKAQRTADDIVTRWRHLLAARGYGDFRAVTAYAVGSEQAYGAHARATPSRESLVWVSAHHDDAAALRLAVREFPSIGLAGAPGTGALPAPAYRNRHQYFGSRRFRYRGNSFPRPSRSTVPQSRSPTSHRPTARPSPHAVPISPAQVTYPLGDAPSP
ncbi:hypothetical protein MTP03_45940 [Tsukamurella sp. PLM1]|nr:hypothetical protein MTP03_45940 [Tsukamurella sp. PLM1]